jgi:hypothetical protein
MEAAHSPHHPPLLLHRPLVIFQVLQSTRAPHTRVTCAVVATSFTRLLLSLTTGTVVGCPYAYCCGGNPDTGWQVYACNGQCEDVPFNTIQYSTVGRISVCFEITATSYTIANAWSCHALGGAGGAAI